MDVRSYHSDLAAVLAASVDRQRTAVAAGQAGGKEVDQLP